MGDPLMGRFASIKIGSALVQNMGRWTLDIRSDEIDVSCFGTVWGKMMIGMQRWTATLEGMYDPADTTGQLALQEAEIAATKLTDVRLYINTTSYWCPDVTGETNAGAFISGVSVSHDKAGVASVTFNVVGFGKLILS